MNQGFIFYPCLALLMITAVALYAMYKGRTAAVKSGDITPAYFKTYDTGDKLPRKARQAERCFHNLMESTPIFYFLCVTTIALGKVDAIFIGMAWLYVVCRALQSLVHLTSNKVGPRSQLFMVSWVVILAYSFRLAYQILP